MVIMQQHEEPVQKTVIILYESKNKDGKGKTQTTIKKQNKTQNNIERK